MKDYFRDFAHYNHWANSRLYAAAFELDEEQRRRPLGLFFGSLHGTLNHLLVADRMWLFRLTGRDPELGPLNKILYDSGADLLRARIIEDARLVALIEDYPEDAFSKTITYQNTSGKSFEQSLTAVLAHVFNHQTHHRGQAHTALSQLTGREPPTFDLVAFQRGVSAPDMNSLVV